MSKGTWLILVMLILAAAALVAFYVHSENSRFYLISGGDNLIYKIDRRTGKTWVILGSGAFEVIEPQEDEPEKQAVNLAKAFKLPPGVYSGTGAEFYINDQLKKTKGDLKINGWRADRIDEQTYLVSYTLELKGTPMGWYFEVNLEGNLVRYITTDSELEQKYRDLIGDTRVLP